VTLIVYGDEVWAVVGARRVYLAPQAVLLAPYSPLGSFVLCMASYAVLVHQGTVPGPYTERRAELFARLVLMDYDEFSRYDKPDLGDRALAGHFMVPVEQIAEKRADLRRFR
jgi:hypothetical protein